VLACPAFQCILPATPDVTSLITLYRRRVSERDGAALRFRENDEELSRVISARFRSRPCHASDGLVTSSGSAVSPGGTARTTWGSRQASRARPLASRAPICGRATAQPGCTVRGAGLLQLLRPVGWRRARSRRPGEGIGIPSPRRTARPRPTALRRLPRRARRGSLAVRARATTLPGARDENAATASRHYQRLLISTADRRLPAATPRRPATRPRFAPGRRTCGAARRTGVAACSST
jgi:hypothetical protein